MAASDDAQRIETQLLADLNGGAGTIADSLAYAAERGIDHAALVGAIRSLASSEMVVVREDARTRWVLTSEAKSYVEHGSPEAQVFRAVKAAMPQGLAMSALRAQIGAEAAAIGFKQAMQLRWVAVQKKPKPAADPAAAAAPPDPAAKGAGKKKKAPKEEPVVLALAEEAEDATRGLLVDVSNGAAVGDKEAQALKKRKLVQLEKTLHYAVSRGPKFALERKKQATDLTRDMLVGDAWRDLEFKKYNFAAMGADTLGGHLHPLLKGAFASTHSVRSQPNPSNTPNPPQPINPFPFPFPFPSGGVAIGTDPALCDGILLTPACMRICVWHIGPRLSLSLACFQCALNSARYLWAWGLRRCQRTVSWRVRFGTSTRCSSRSSTPRATPTTHSSSPDRPRPPTLGGHQTTSNACAPHTKREGMAASDTVTTGRSQKPRRIYCARTPQRFRRACFICLRRTTGGRESSRPSATFPSIVCSETKP